MVKKLKKNTGWFKKLLNIQGGPKTSKNTGWFKKLKSTGWFKNLKKIQGGSFCELSSTTFIHQIIQVSLALMSHHISGFQIK